MRRGILGRIQLAEGGGGEDGVCLGEGDESIVAGCVEEEGEGGGGC